DIVETRADEVDGAGNSRRVDLDAGVLCQRFLAADSSLSLGAGGQRPAYRRAGALGCNELSLLTLQRPPGFLGALLGFHPRIHIEELPSEDDHYRKGDRNEIIAVFFHHAFLERVSSDRFGFDRLSMRSTSWVANSVKGTDSTSRRATMT